MLLQQMNLLNCNDTDSLCLQGKARRIQFDKVRIQIFQKSLESDQLLLQNGNSTFSEVSVDEFERARRANKDKRYQRAMQEIIATGRTDRNDNKFRKKKAISRWESAYKHEPTTPLGHSQEKTAVSSPSSIGSSISPPVQPIRLISPQKKSRSLSQTLCQDLAAMLSEVSKEASKNNAYRSASPTRSSPHKNLKSFSVQTGLQESLAMNFRNKDCSSVSCASNVSEESPKQFTTTYPIDSPLEYYSPVKKRTALRLPTDNIFRDVRDMMIRSSLQSQINDSSLLLVQSDDTSCADDEIDSLYDIESCSEHSFDDNCDDDDDGIDYYDDFTTTSYDESYSDDASFVSSVLQQSLEVRP